MATNVVTRDELIDRVSQLVPQLRKNAVRSDETRRLADDSIDALADAGVFRLRTPKRYGGLEADTRTLVDVAAELGRADGSLSWVASVYWIPTWMAGLFPDHVQDQVFGESDSRVCGTLSPTGMAAPAEGGIVVNGSWKFISGAHHSTWQEIVAVLITPDQQPLPVVAMVPMSQLGIIDDWHTSGLRGTGSVTTVAQDVFVPEGHYLPLPLILQGQSASERNADSPIYRSPLLPVASASSVGTLIGLGRAAREAFLERLPDRKITYTEYASQAEAPLTHHQVAAAVQHLDEAEFHAYRLAGQVDGKCADGAGWTVEERARARAGLGAVVSRTKQAVDILGGASGGSSIYEDVPIQRIQRDVHAAHLHALMHPETNAELYGRVLCGLPPNTLYI
ncbi:acyl-CoA dehydrogenase family protein [Actinoplanes sp. NPDC051861]|uniref:acyl-CoA dehydrogenase family protein n=1 Tax=Actinoplanes sp. NPDC051861 TaxID=3155170 RepID=UPI00341A24BB